MKYEIQRRPANNAPWTPYGWQTMEAEKAAQCCAELNDIARADKRAVRYRVVPIQEMNWREREMNRIRAGIGQLPKSWDGITVYFPDYHFPRLVKPGLIGYFASERDAATGRLTELVPSRYLNTFIYNVIQDPMTLAEAAGAKVERPHVIFTDVTSEITKVYLSAGREGSPCSSCATKPADFFATSGVHPSVIYGKPGNVALLYTLADGVKHINDANARVTARCLIYPENKVHVMSYGYPQDRGHIDSWLKANGYKPGSWVGCQLNLHLTPYNEIITAQCDFAGRFKVTLEAGKPVMKVTHSGWFFGELAHHYNCYSRTGIAGKAKPEIIKAYRNAP